MQLNLARKWRSPSFGQIVGQELAVRILKNSLFLGKFFPVYLLAGQHGCGKTTTARVFAAAINCALLPDFQHDPQKIIVPCGTCSSCCAMKAGKHPDFIEIDAASHTGVDNVRQLLEAATLMPLMGRKKIYLIDEAHMLSKAAFNAFLKMLEEPCDSVLFMLATTDDHKIIETVKSRCFQLFFQAVESQTLCAHLQHVCEQESISYEPDGLALIVRQSQGSVRDALNMTEQVFLSEQRVGKAEVLRVLGAASDEVILELLAQLFQASCVQDFSKTVQQLDLERYNAEYLWRQLLEALRTIFFVKCGCEQQKNNLNLQGLDLEKVSFAQLSDLFSWWCAEEALFLRTVNQSIFLQIFLVRAWGKLHAPSADRKEDFALHAAPSNRVSSAPAPQNTRVVAPVHEARHVQETSTSPRELVQEPAARPESIPQPVPSTWQTFIQELESLQEPLLVSIFKQANVILCDESQVQVNFAQRLIFLKDTLEQSRERWAAVFTKNFGAAVVLQYQFVGADIDVKKKPSSVTVNTGVTHVGVSQNTSAYHGTPRSIHSGTSRIVSTQKYVQTHEIDISDKNRWPLTHALLEYFPGKVTCVVEPVAAAKKQVVYDDNSQE